MTARMRIKYFGVGGAIGGLLGFIFCEPIRGKLIITPGIDTWIYEKGFIQLDTYYQYVEQSLYGLVIGGLIGLLVGVTYGILLRNYWKAIKNGLLGAVGGLMGGAIGGAVGNWAFGIFVFSNSGRIVAWTLFGTFTGFLIARFAPEYKTIHGLLGGMVGGLVGGLVFSGVSVLFSTGFVGRGIGITIIGFCIGIFISLAEIVLKKAWLEVDYARGQSMQYFIHQQLFRMGTSPTCNLRLFGKQLEPRHAEIRVEKNEYVLHKIAQQNPLYLNGESIDSKKLRDGDQIEIADTIIKFKLK